MSDCLIGLGSNLGDRPALLRQAVRLLEEVEQNEVVAVSHAYTSQPAGGPEGQGAFLNAAVRLTTTLSPQSLLDVLHRIEDRLGRTRTERWAARLIDLDLLLYGDTVLQSDALILPHPRMTFRRFVLAPAVEIAAEMIHPELGWSVARLLQSLDKPPFNIVVTGPNPASNAAVVRKVLQEAKATRTFPRESSIQAIACPGETSQTFIESLTQAMRQTPTPTLLVMLDTDLSRVNNAMRQQVQSCVPCPILWLDASDQETAIQEITAAIDASQWPCTKAKRF